MAEKKKSKKIFKGFVEVLRMKPGFSIDSCEMLDEIDRNMYFDFLPSSVPLHEIDSPIDIYKMYINGALLIGLEDEEKIPLYDNNEKKAIGAHGDLIVLNYANSKKSIVLMFVDKTKLKCSPDELQPYSPMTISTDLTNMRLINLRNLPQFQYMFW